MSGPPTAGIARAWVFGKPWYAERPAVPMAAGRERGSSDMCPRRKSSKGHTGSKRKRDRHAERLLASLVHLYERQGPQAVWAALEGLIKQRKEDET